VPVFASYWKYIKDYLSTGIIFLLNLYKDDRDSILFGQKAFTIKEADILRMVKRIPQ